MTENKTEYLLRSPPPSWDQNCVFITGLRLPEKVLTLSTWSWKKCDFSWNPEKILIFQPILKKSLLWKCSISVAHFQYQHIFMNSDIFPSLISFIFLQQPFWCKYACREKRCSLNIHTWNQNSKIIVCKIFHLRLRIISYADLLSNIDITQLHIRVFSILFT